MAGSQTFTPARCVGSQGLLQHQGPFRLPLLPQMVKVVIYT